MAPLGHLWVRFLHPSIHLRLMVVCNAGTLLPVANISFFFAWLIPDRNTSSCLPACLFLWLPQLPCPPTHTFPNKCCAISLQLGIPRGLRQSVCQKQLPLQEAAIVAAGRLCLFIKRWAFHKPVCMGKVCANQCVAVRIDRVPSPIEHDVSELTNAPYKLQPLFRSFSWGQTTCYACAKNGCSSQEEGVLLIKPLHVSLH